MIDRSTIEQIIAQYVKHGWTLRRVLLSQGVRANLGDTLALFGNDVEIADSTLDAAWFSRSSKPDVTAWELRRLSGTPYALLIGVENDLASGEIDSILNKTEEKMFAASSGTK